MKFEDLTEILSRVTFTSNPDLTLETLLSTLDWDSLAQISFIAECDELGYSISPTRLDTARTVQDLLEVVSESQA